MLSSGTVSKMALVGTDMVVALQRQNQTRLIQVKLHRCISIVAASVWCKSACFLFVESGEGWTCSNWQWSHQTNKRRGKKRKWRLIESDWSDQTWWWHKLHISVVWLKPMCNNWTTRQLNVNYSNWKQWHTLAHKNIYDVDHYTPHDWLSLNQFPMRKWKIASC